MMVIFMLEKGKYCTCFERCVAVAVPVAIAVVVVVVLGVVVVVVVVVVQCCLLIYLVGHPT